jgi:antitoxin VapB
VRPAWESLRAALRRGVSEDFMTDGRDQPLMQEGTELDELFR